MMGFVLVLVRSGGGKASIRYIQAVNVDLEEHFDTNVYQAQAAPVDRMSPVRTSTWQPSELGRLECRQDFAYGREWNGKFYETKQVRPIFVEESDVIVVVTVYSYYF